MRARSWPTSAKKRSRHEGPDGEHFAKTGMLDAKYHQWLLAAFEERITADYDVGESIEASKADTMIQQAREFLHTAQQYLAREP